MGWTGIGGGGRGVAGRKSNRFDFVGEFSKSSYNSAFSFHFFSMNKRIAIYPGTFDPVTNGHLNIIRRALRLYDHLIVAVAYNPRKNPMFAVEDRVRFIREAMRGQKNLEVVSFSNLLVEFAASRKASVIIKGLRAVSDFEAELQMGLMNRNLNDSLETMFMIPSQEYSFLSSSFVKEIARHGGDISNLVPKGVQREIQKLKMRGE